MSRPHRIAIGADHGGFDLKNTLVLHLQKAGYQVEDVGTSSHEAVDYPVFARAVAEAVSEGRADVGIMIDGAGIGSCMVANKIPKVRAALAYDLSSARNSREHNGANVLTLGAGLIGASLARQIVDVWLATECTEQRHLDRVAMFADEQADMTLSDEDLDRVVARLQQIVGPMTQVEPGGPCVGDNPETAREFVRLGATGLTSVAPAEQPGSIPGDLARYIDHTLLKPNATEEQIRTLCAEALEFNFRSVCVNPTWVPLAARLLRGSEVLTCTVVGFPLGANEPAIKAMEARRAIRNGAREIDMVINIGALKSGDDALVLRDIRAVVEDCVDGNAVCKVILETALLSDAEKRRASELARQARAHFVKTSTGFSTGGATVGDVALMAEVVRGAGMEVKASGGISSYSDAKAMIEAGATRLGASASIGIVREAKSTSMSA
ncbi:MAG: deoxyribose-phosphate aldolase [Gammaproteobacteria bacterium]|nr:deoxyribose-phosphate aldolase [Gammaproteobacteria bacterium]MBT8111734.1 deoxyribose-phosphate aldolase [Gammaproteobacteria bacterium]